MGCRQEAVRDEPSLLQKVRVAADGVHPEAIDGAPLSEHIPPLQ